MMIISKNRSNIVNCDYVTEIYIGNDGTAIRINFENGGRYDLERYDSRESANIAMAMLCDVIGKADRFIMPTEKEIQAYIVRTHDAAPRHINGKKTKSHGGS